MKGEAEKKTTAASDAVKENQAQVVESSTAAAASVTAAAAANSALPARQPFTQLSQLESDMAIARALQEQEQAYMLLRSGGSYDGGNNPGDEDSEEEHEDVQGEISTLIDGSHYENDEEFARALQEAEYRETTARMMALAGIQDVGEDDDDEEDDDEQGNDEDEGGEEESEEEDDDEDEDDEQEQDEDDEDGSDDESQEMWQDVDPDNMSYEELIALGEVVGTESKGLASNIIDELPLSSHKRDLTGSSSSSDCEQCVICRHDYEEEEQLLTLPCKHKYHSECIRQWLQINKVCPVCSADVS